MANELLKNVRVNELPQSAGPKGTYLLPMFNVDNDTLEKVNVSEFISANSSNNFEFAPNTEYLEDAVVTYGGVWWQALQDMSDTDNIVPGTDSLYWAEVSKSPSGFVLWQAGIFVEDEIFVVHELEGTMYIFYLTDPARPYTSTDIEAEFAAGDWGVLGELDHFRGYYTTEAALDAIVGRPGDYAYVDAGVGSDSLKYIWDNDDAQWIEAGSGGAATFAELGGVPSDNAALAAALAAKQAVNAKLTQISGLTLVDDDVIQQKGGVLVNRNMVQLKTDLAITPADIAGVEIQTNKGVSGGYVGMSGFSIAFKNLANTFTSLLQNAATAARTYIFPDYDIVVAGRVDVIGVQDIPIIASAMWPRLTGGATPLQAVVGANNNNYQFLEFPVGSQTFAQFAVTLPRNYDNQPITAVFKWMATAGTAAQTVEFTIAAVCFGDNVSLDAARGTPVTVSDALQNTNRLHISAVSAAFTIAGGAADGKTILFEVSRVGTGTDNLAAPARLMEVILYVTTDAAKAA